MLNYLTNLFQSKKGQMATLAWVIASSSIDVYVYAKKKTILTVWSGNTNLLHLLWTYLVFPGLICKIFNKLPDFTKSFQDKDGRLLLYLGGPQERFGLGHQSSVPAPCYEVASGQESNQSGINFKKLDPLSILNNFICTRNMSPKPICLCLQ